MIITWWGKTCFTIKGDKTTLVINPPAKETGLKMPKVKADLVLFSEKALVEAELKKIKDENSIIISKPGEYDVGGFFVFGIAGSQKSEKKDYNDSEPNIFVIRHEQKTICHITRYSFEALTGEDLEQLGDVDILMIPVGGPTKNPITLDADKAAKITNQVEPHIVIPMRYAVKGAAEKLESAEKFLKEMGAGKGRAEDKLKIKKNESLGQKETEVVILTPAGV